MIKHDKHDNHEITKHDKHYNHEITKYDKHDSYVMINGRIIIWQL